MCNIRTDIIDSYKELIRNCESQIQNEIEIDKNKFLIEEYNYVLNEVENKTEEYYRDLLKEIDKIYKLSEDIKEFLSPIMPYEET